MMKCSIRKKLVISSNGVCLTGRVASLHEISENSCKVNGLSYNASKLYISFRTNTDRSGILQLPLDTATECVIISMESPLIRGLAAFAGGVAYCMGTQIMHGMG